MMAPLRYTFRNKDRWYFRRGAHPLVRLPGDVGQPEFMAAYADALARYGPPPKDAAPPKAPPPPVAWLLDHVGHTGDECLLWPFGGLDEGYGALRFEGRFERAHRAMCRLAHGEPPKGRPYALHSCGNGDAGCVNPNHLRWGTQKENLADRDRHGRTLRGVLAPSSKLTEADVIMIRDRIGRGDTKMAVAADYGVSAPTIRAIVTGKTWTHV
jgi:hypothetical protein